MTAPTSSPFHSNSPSSSRVYQSSRDGSSNAAAAPLTERTTPANQATEPTDDYTNLTPMALALFQEARRNDEDFANLMRERTKKRREREDAALAHLRVQVRRLEAALTAETKRRVQAVAEVKAQAQQAVENVTAHWKDSLEKEGNETNERLALLEARIGELEERWERDVVKVEGAISAKSSAWKAALEDLKSEADAERKSRLQREGRLLQRIHEVSEQYQDQWKEERHLRVAELSALTERVHIQEEARGAQVRNLESRILEALQDLNSALKKEAFEREAEDQIIVNALNKYTSDVQTSLTFTAV